jgi:WD40 repeat protein
MQTLTDHLLDVTAVAVSKDEQPLIVSASDDGTVRVWERNAQNQRWQVRSLLRNPGAVKAVACTPRGAAANLCLSGAADGHGRLWDLNSRSEQPLRELAEGHKGPITCSAFSPDGKTCATGGEDREIRLWDTATGELRYRLPTPHRGGITTLAFTPDSHLVSVGRDNTLRYWKLHAGGAELETTIPQRTGDVPSLGVSPDGKRVLFDQGKTLRVLSLPRGITEGVLRNPSGAANFTTFAQFSPDGRLILTSGGAEGRLQLWQAPLNGDRPREVLQLVPRSTEPATCCAFAPDGSFVVTGS